MIGMSTGHQLVTNIIPNLSELHGITLTLFHHLDLIRSSNSKAIYELLLPPTFCTLSQA